MKIIQTAVAAAAFVLATGGASIAQSSFDCRRPQTEAAATICSVPALAERDRQVEAAYRRALQSAAEPNRVRDNHTAWANSLSICHADRQCLAELLDEELGALNYASSRGPEQAEVATMEPAPRQEVVAAHIDAAAEQFPEAPPTVKPAPSMEAELLPEEPVRVLDPVSNEVDTAVPSQSSPREVSAWEGAFAGGLLLIPILGVIAALLATKSLAEHTSRRFNWPLILNWWNVLYLVGIFGGLFVSTMGIPVAGLGFFGAICLVMLVVNVSKTNLLTGLAMTVVQPFVVAILWVAYGITKAQVQGRRT